MEKWSSFSFSGGVFFLHQERDLSRRGKIQWSPAVVSRCHKWSQRKEKNRHVLVLVHSWVFNKYVVQISLFLFRCTNWKDLLNALLCCMRCFKFRKLFICVWENICLLKRMRLIAFNFHALWSQITKLWNKTPS